MDDSSTKSESFIYRQKKPSDSNPNPYQVVRPVNLKSGIWKFLNFFYRHRHAKRRKDNENCEQNEGDLSNPTYNNTQFGLCLLSSELDADEPSLLMEKHKVEDTDTDTEDKSASESSKGFFHKINLEGLMKLFADLHRKKRAKELAKSGTSSSEEDPPHTIPEGTSKPVERVERYVKVNTTISLLKEMSTSRASSATILESTFYPSSVPPPTNSPMKTFIKHVEENPDGNCTLNLLESVRTKLADYLIAEESVNSLAGNCNDSTHYNDLIDDDWSTRLANTLDDASLSCDDVGSIKNSSQHSLRGVSFDECMLHNDTSQESVPSRNDFSQTDETLGGQLEISEEFLEEAINSEIIPHLVGCSTDEKPEFSDSITLDNDVNIVKKEFSNVKSYPYADFDNLQMTFKEGFKRNLSRFDIIDIPPDLNDCSFVEIKNENSNVCDKTSTEIMGHTDSQQDGKESIQAQFKNVNCEAVYEKEKEMLEGEQEVSIVESVSNETISDEKTRQYLNNDVASNDGVDLEKNVNPVLKPVDHSKKSIDMGDKSQINAKEIEDNNCQEKVEHDEKLGGSKKTDFFAKTQKVWNDVHVANLDGEESEKTEKRTVDKDESTRAESVLNSGEGSTKLQSLEDSCKCINSEIDATQEDDKQLHDKVEEKDKSIGDFILHVEEESSTNIISIENKTENINKIEAERSKNVEEDTTIEQEGTLEETKIKEGSINFAIKPETIEADLYESITSLENAGCAEYDLEAYNAATSLSDVLNNSIKVSNDLDENIEIEINNNNRKMGGSKDRSRNVKFILHEELDEIENKSCTYKKHENLDNTGDLINFSEDMVFSLDDVVNDVNEHSVYDFMKLHAEDFDYVQNARVVNDQNYIEIGSHDNKNDDFNTAKQEDDEIANIIGSLTSMKKEIININDQLSDLKENLAEHFKESIVNVTNIAHLINLEEQKIKINHQVNIKNEDLHVNIEEQLSDLKENNDGVPNTISLTNTEEQSFKIEQEIKINEETLKDLDIYVDEEDDKITNIASLINLEEQECILEYIKVSKSQNVIEDQQDINDEKEHYQQQEFEISGSKNEDIEDTTKIGDSIISKESKTELLKLPFAETPELTYAQAEEDIKIMIRELLFETEDIKETIIASSTHSLDDFESAEVCKDVLDSIVNNLQNKVSDSKCDENLPLEEPKFVEVTNIMDSILDKVCSTADTKIYKNVVSVNYCLIQNHFNDKLVKSIKYPDSRIIRANKSFRSYYKVKTCCCPAIGPRVTVVNLSPTSQARIVRSEDKLTNRIRRSAALLMALYEEMRDYSYYSCTSNILCDLYESMSRNERYIHLTDIPRNLEIRPENFIAKQNENFFLNSANNDDNREDDIAVSQSSETQTDEFCEANDSTVPSQSGEPSIVNSSDVVSRNVSAADSNSSINSDSEEEIPIADILPNLKYTYYSQEEINTNEELEQIEINVKKNEGKDLGLDMPQIESASSDSIRTDVAINENEGFLRIDSQEFAN